MKKCSIEIPFSTFYLFTGTVMKGSLNHLADLLFEDISD